MPEGGRGGGERQKNRNEREPNPNRNECASFKETSDNWAKKRGNRKIQKKRTWDYGTSRKIPPQHPPIGSGNFYWGGKNE